MRGRCGRPLQPDCTRKALARVCRAAHHRVALTQLVRIVEVRKSLRARRGLAAIGGYMICVLNLSPTPLLLSNASTSLKLAPFGIVTGGAKSVLAEGLGALQYEWHEDVTEAFRVVPFLTDSDNLFRPETWVAMCSVRTESTWWPGCDSNPRPRHSMPSYPCIRNNLLPI
jgi:hypothetical protein